MKIETFRNSLIVLTSLYCLCECQAEPKVVVQTKGSGYVLAVGGKPFQIKGGGGDESWDLLAKLGGNSVRTWGAENLDSKLALAQKCGIKVAVGIWLGHEEHGFKYTDAAAVQKQYEEAISVVKKYKDNPAVLLWSFGNEMEGYAQGDNPLIWNAVNAIAKEAKRLDPNHPTMTVIAEVGGKKVPSFNRYCPDVDILGINSYGGAASVIERYQKAGGTKPVVITEFGPPGTWESGKTSWGAAPELTSTEKSKIYGSDYQSFAGNPICLGSYAFAWGHKQEATATWFGLFLPDGSPLEAVETLSKLWKGDPSTNQTPKISSFKLQGAAEVEPSAKLQAVLSAESPAGSALKVDWVLQNEAGGYGNNGDSEAVPPTYPEAVVKKGAGGCTLIAPKRPGGYRLFVYIKDESGRAATANIPFLVTGTDNPLAGQPVQLPVFIYNSATGKAAYAPSGWMGDTSALHFDGNCKENPLPDCTKCLSLKFDKSDGWAGIAWQQPEGDWGDKMGGFDLSGARRLAFSARSSIEGTKINVGVGLIKRDKPYFDTGNASASVSLSTEWKEYSVYLDGLDLSRIKTGFFITFGAEGSPRQVFLDKVRIE